MNDSRINDNRIESAIEKAKTAIEDALGLPHGQRRPASDADDAPAADVSARAVEALADREENRDDRSPPWTKNP